MATRQKTVKTAKTVKAVKASAPKTAKANEASAPVVDTTYKCGESGSGYGVVTVRPAAAKCITFSAVALEKLALLAKRNGGKICIFPAYTKNKTHVCYTVPYDTINRW